MLCETVSVSKIYEGALGVGCHVVPRWKTWLQSCHGVCVAQEGRVRSSVNININVESWWGRCRLAVGKGRRLAHLPSMMQPGSRLSTIDHALLYPFAFVARVGDLTRQAGLDSLVPCRKRLPLSHGKR
jgi:hypothetical protein